MELDLRIDSLVQNLQGVSIALVSDISFNSELIILNYILDGLKAGQPVCIVTFIKSSSNVLDTLANLSEEAAILVNEALMNEQLNVIDGYSFRSGDLNEDIPGVVFLPDNEDLTRISIEINTISKQYEFCRFVMWPLSLLMLYTSVNQIAGFLQTQVARIATRKQSFLYVIDRGVLSEREQVIVESLMDGVFEMKLPEDANKGAEMFRVKFMRGANLAELSSWISLA